jgi:hypothetical protein
LTLLWLDISIVVVAAFVVWQAGGPFGAKYPPRTATFWIARRSRRDNEGGCHVPNSACRRDDIFADGITVGIGRGFRNIGAAYARTQLRKRRRHRSSSALAPLARLLRAWRSRLVDQPAGMQKGGWSRRSGPPMQRLGPSRPPPHLLQARRLRLVVKLAGVSSPRRPCHGEVEMSLGLNEAQPRAGGCGRFFESGGAARRPSNAGYVAP